MTSSLIWYELLTSDPGAAASAKERQHEHGTFELFVERTINAAPEAADQMRPLFDSP
jgi:hypothetical protein